MDPTEDEREARAASRRRRPRDERARAVRYLDLWERHVSLMAVDGVPPWTTPAARKPRPPGTPT